MLLLEHTDKAGAKILISGGGRCNFTNLATAPDRFLSGNPHFCTSALRRYTQSDFIELVRRHGIAFHEKTLGQLFCDGSARAIVAMLLAECAAGGVDLRLGQTVTERVAGGAGSASRRNRAASPRRRWCWRPAACPSPRWAPRVSATTWRAASASRDANAARPGAAEGRADTAGFDAALAGVALEAVATFEKRSFRENILFTHRGLSGPAILQISSYWRPGDADHPRSAAGHRRGARSSSSAKRTRPKAAPQTVLAEVMPTRLAQALTAAHLPAGEMANIRDRDARRLCRRLEALAVRARLARKATPRPR